MMLSEKISPAVHTWGETGEFEGKVDFYALAECR
jgi:hypothetical protein